MDSSLDIYVVTFNCGRAKVDIKALSAHLLKPYRDHAIETKPDFIVLNLQEIAPVGYALLGGSFLAPFWDQIHAAVHRAAQQARYRQVATHNAGMTGITILAKEDIAENVQWIEMADVGVGPLEMAIKGAAGLRLGYSADASEAELVFTFVAAHLAAGEKRLKLRNKNWESIVKGLSFVPTRPRRVRKSIDGNSEDNQPDSASLLTETEDSTNTGTGMFTSSSVLFFAGDLNYRTSDIGPGPDDYKSFPQPTRDAKDEKHFSRLLAHDQLTREKKTGKILQNLSEGAIDFPPTYKYALDHYDGLPSQNEGEAIEPSTWYWATHRFPSWCDRIFFSSYLTESPSSLKILAYDALPIQPTTDHRPVALATQLSLQNAWQAAEKFSSESSAPFPLDPDALNMRVAARRREIVLGLLAYLTWTWEGNGILLATTIGAIGGWLILRSLFAS